MPFIPLQLTAHWAGGGAIMRRDDLFPGVTESPQYPEEEHGQHDNAD
jgi:hypothetical protein